MKSQGSRNNCNPEGNAKPRNCSLWNEAVGKSLVERFVGGEEKSHFQTLLCLGSGDQGRQMSADKNTAESVRTSAERKQLFNSAEPSLSLQHRKGTCVNTASNSSLQLFYEILCSCQIPKTATEMPCSEDGG